MTKLPRPRHWKSHYDIGDIVGFWNNDHIDEFGIVVVDKLNNAFVRIKWNVCDYESASIYKHQKSDGNLINFGKISKKQAMAIKLIYGRDPFTQ